MAAKLLDYLLFQAAWFACVRAGTTGETWLALLATAVNGGLHLRFATDRPRVLWASAVAAGLGLAVDTLLLHAGAVRFPQADDRVFPPLFMTTLWINLATTLPLSLGWLSRRYALAAVLGAVGGSIAYRAGQPLGAIQIGGLPGLMLIAAVWAVAMPTLVLIHDRLATAAQGVPA